MPSVYGIENPLMDIICSVDYKTLEKTQAPSGSMNLIDREKMEIILSLCAENKIGEYTHTPGGSCANTMRGIAWLIGETGGIEQPAYSGAVGDDINGAEFEVLLRTLGVLPHLSKTVLPTGVSIIFITPDHERTMFTFLGACRSFTRDNINMEYIAGSRFFYSTGYMWDTENQKDALEVAAVRAQEKGVPIAFDIADPFVVSRYGKDLASWIPGHVAILFANREELKAMTSATGSDEEIIDAARGLAPMVVMKTGKDGCCILDSGKITKIPGERVKAVDTTGAGDSFAAGFLFGLLQGLTTESSGKLANRIASRIVTVEGCDFLRLDRDEVMNGLMV